MTDLSSVADKAKKAAELGALLAAFSMGIYGAFFKKDETSVAKTEAAYSILQERMADDELYLKFLMEQNRVLVREIMSLKKEMVSLKLALMDVRPAPKSNKKYPGFGGSAGDVKLYEEMPVQAPERVDSMVDRFENRKPLPESLEFAE